MSNRDIRFLAVLAMVMSLIGLACNLAALYHRYHH